MARLEVQKPSVDGTTERNNRTEAGAAHTPVADMADKYPNSGKEWLRITKGTGAAVMTVTSQARDPYGSVRAAKTVTIDASSTKYYGPYDPGEHNEKSGADKDYTSIAFSEVTGLEVTVLRM